MRAPLVGAAFLAACLPAMVRAQSLALTESEALSRLSDDSPRVRVIRGDIEVAGAEMLAAGRWPNPRLTYDREAVAGGVEHIASVAQPLPLTGRRGLEVRAASALLDAASKRTDDGVRRARADLKLAFADLVAAQRREEYLQAAGQRLRDVVEILTHREAAGDAAGFDRMRAERELFDLDADVSIAAVERSRAQGALTTFFVGVDPGTVVAKVSPVAPQELPPLAALIERAENTRGELAALRYEAASAGFAAQAADRRKIPEPEVVAGTKSSTMGSGDVGSVVSVVVPIPLFDRGRPERALAVAHQRRAIARAELFQQTLRAEVASLRDTVDRRRRAATEYRDRTIRSVADIERIARVSYEAAERGILELLDAHRTRLAATDRQTRLDLAVRQSEVELEFATGWELSQ